MLVSFIDFPLRFLSVWKCMMEIECAAWQSNLGRAVAFLE